MDRERLQEATTSMESGARSRRSEAIAHIEQGNHAAAMEALLSGLSPHPSLADCHLVAQLAQRLDFSSLPFSTARVALLGSFTLDPLIPVIATKGYQNGIRIADYVGGFNAWQLEAADPGSPIYRFAPDVIFVLLRPEELCPRLVRGAMALSQEEREEEVERVAAEIDSFLDAIRARSGAKVVLTNLPRPPHPPLGILDYQRPDGQQAAFLRLNQRMVELVNRHEGVWILDLERLQALIGYNAWFDSRMWGAARMPLSPAAIQALSDEMIKFLRATQGFGKKCLVLDLDNTLWGGILGEDGPEDIQLGAEYPGRAYIEFQEAILDLYHRGVILAINSKNNEAEARTLLGSHPAMVLRPNHFAAMQINWQSKVENMRHLAAELNIGLDSMVFVDDSPVECSLMRQMLPEVLTVQLDGDPLDRASKLRGLGVFDTLSYSQEDRQRGALYQGQVARERLRREAPTLEEFYRSLEMEIAIQPVTRGALGRAAQLTQRTNQFNLAPTRYSESEIAQLMESPDHSLFTLQLQDRFGDNGIVGLAIARREGSDVVIESFLLSCRVLGRMVESALLVFLLDQARQDGAQRVIGLYRPTKKNQQVADFYAQHGFELLEESGDGTAWVLPSAQFHRPYPEHFRLGFQR